MFFLVLDCSRRNIASFRFAKFIQLLMLISYDFNYLLYVLFFCNAKGVSLFFRSYLSIDMDDYVFSGFYHFIICMPRVFLTVITLRLFNILGVTSCVTKFTITWSRALGCARVANSLDEALSPNSPRTSAYFKADISDK